MTIRSGRKTNPAFEEIFFDLLQLKCSQTGQIDEIVDREIDPTEISTDFQGAGQCLESKDWIRKVNEEELLEDSRRRRIDRRDTDEDIVSWLERVSVR